jgi:transglutaminase-like putative cysteine protease
MTKKITLLLLIPACLPALAGAPQKIILDPNQPYQARKSNPVSYDVDFSVVVTAPAGTKLLKVWLPLPQTDGAQEVSASQISTFPNHVVPKVAREKVFGNTFAYFEFPNPDGGQILRHKFKIKVWEQRWDLDPKKVVRVADWPAGFAPYLKADHSVVVDDRLRKLTREIVPAPKDPAGDLSEVMDWIDAHLTYDPAQGSLTGSSVHALDKRTGHCSDYHGLCAAFGRALNVPTRVTYGIIPLPRNSPTHCKCEAYLPPYGWVCFDVSETQNQIKRIKAAPALAEKEKQALIHAAKERLRHGFRDNTWFLQTRGTDYELAPPASKRVPLVRTAYAEADGRALPDPDPANASVREFSWMTVHRYQPDRRVIYPFADWKSLRENK